MSTASGGGRVTVKSLGALRSGVEGDASLYVCVCGGLLSSAAVSPAAAMLCLIDAVSAPLGLTTGLPLRTLIAFL